MEDGGCLRGWRSHTMLVWLFILLTVTPVATFVGQPGFGAAWRLPQATWITGVLLLTVVLYMVLRRVCGTWFVIDRAAGTVTTGWQCIVRVRGSSVPLQSVDSVRIRWTDPEEISLSASHRYTVFLRGSTPIDLTEIDGEGGAREEALRIAQFLEMGCVDDQSGKSIKPAGGVT